jgi:RNA recognition motif-containing protein
MVREDREDRDVKGYNAAAGEVPTRSGRGAGARGGRGRGGRGPAAAPQREGESSGLQVVVQGIPWKYTWRELKDLFASEFTDIERADVVIGNDGRSRGYGTVRFTGIESANSAIEKYNGTELEGRTLTVKLDKFA